jgi:hypothetical protein
MAYPNSRTDSKSLRLRREAVLLQKGPALSSARRNAFSQRFDAAARQSSLGAINPFVQRSPPVPVSLPLDVIVKEHAPPEYPRIETAFGRKSPEPFTEKGPNHIRRAGLTRPRLVKLEEDGPSRAPVRKRIQRQFNLLESGNGSVWCHADAGLKRARTRTPLPDRSVLCARIPVISKVMPDGAVAVYPPSRPRETHLQQLCLPYRQKAVMIKKS